MAEAERALGEFGYAGDDAVVPFNVEALEARGRAVQLGPMLDQILGRHDYPEPVSRLLAEMIALTVLLGTSLKFDGKFIAQTQTDGPVDLLVVDFATPSSVRAYARFDDAKLDAAISAGTTHSEALLGKGVMALTVDQGAYMQRYQGIVELNGTSMEEVAEAYFRQSEQIPTAVKLAVAKIARRGENGFVEGWRAGGLIAQFLPEAPERMRLPDLPGGDAPEGADDPEGSFEPDDAWVEVRALVDTIDASELADPDVGVERLLFRLFHERGVRVFPAKPVADDCSCTRERIRDVLSNFSQEEIGESVEDGKIAVTCEFCGEGYEFDPAEFEADATSGDAPASE
ncbi:Hsp33 family molecular chaperone [Aurantimonas sp. C2-6-R+9]|uniref:Hsp33 family molecular chaperone n=1 Tax=unclassified Aurantimonas TaxID=2638230 RepID=UPI002E197941|nr:MULTISPECIES: Hsp33 family molecular chaperone [unclassified Aurantimonas]MEC5289263.1 Hsp33 family molecular chaperone [Aurantimonas sp. C2-3-R2]MEC5324636.1 Hsp33 family molecular chaperone [Aurantimonas sp. A3-2-R12]MEC5380101.1 Hsp33 family molecular chaperone [Aurantimonas sp. C2-6-R+9]MEC5410287.1 Hsp33 family molecular chaperone [Aurantimonas sp. C2-4-R8]